jgi:hypothetical protein
MRSLLCLVLVAAACGGAPPPTKLGPEPPAQTTAKLAGSRCSGTTCKCRAQGDTAKEDPPPEQGTKRFELRISRGPGKVWVTIDGNQQLYADTESAESCFYVDLGTGKHEVVLRGRSQQLSGGVGAGLQVSEYAPGPEKEAPWWYDTAYFQCGHPGPCEPETLRAWKKEVDEYPRQLRDPCGSTKVRTPSWETGTLPDGLHPDDFMASLVLDVYPFSPKTGPGDCAKAKAQ